MNDGAIIPFSKKLGKLSILILEGYIRSKVGDGFVDELGKPYIKHEKLAKALQHTEKIFVKRYDDKELAHAMFVDLKQSDRPILREAILTFLDHPTDPDFPEAIREILASEFSFLETERINQAVITYLNILTEELSLEDSDFREKMVALISIRGGDLWSNSLSVRSNSSKDIIPRKVDIILEGDFEKFNRKKKTQFLRTISSLLNVDQKQIRILSAKPGSIILRVALPGYALLILAKMILEESLDMRRIGVLSVKTKGEIYKYTKDLRITVIGQGSVGKTSLVRRLIENTFSDDRYKTEGIDIHQWRVKIEDERFKMHVWDFGGQEIMHGTHQFFLSKNALYILVLDSRLTAEENRMEYWLETIKTFAGESPVIVVGNKIDQHALDIDQVDVRKKYFAVEDIREISCATGKGILELKQAIGKAIKKIPYAYLELALPLFAVKHKIELLQSNYNYIDYKKYESLCESEDVFDADIQREFVNYLHEMGILLYFQNDVGLIDFIVLNPQWLTNGIYKILNSHALFQNKGVLTISVLDEILNLPEYPIDERLFIVNMMRKFELCYDIEADKTFLVPDLLPRDEPQLNFDGIPAFEYDYLVLPSNVITRFIVRMNQNLNDGLAWRTGVLLKIGENRVLVKADVEDHKITIAIDGLEQSRRDALSAVRYQLDGIHSSIKDLNVQKLVPIPEAPSADPIKYEYLLKMEQAGQMTILVDNGNNVIKVNVHDILNNIENRDQRLETRTGVTNIYVNGNFNGNLTVGDGNQSLKDSYKKITSAKIFPELKETLLQLGEAVDAMIQKLPAEQATEVAEDFGNLADEAVKTEPNQKWYSVSIDGLIKAAENLDKLGTPVISLSRKVLSLLTGGVVK